MARYAISDIHGCAKTLKKMIELLHPSKQDDELYLLGDYIDRGPDSMGVIKYIWKLEDKGYNVHCLLGNHESMVLNAARGLQNVYEWMPPAKYRHETLSWLRGLEYYFDIPGYYLVHAGFNFNAPDPLVHRYDMLWIRGWYADLDLKWLGDKIIVHGHTPEPIANIREGIKHMQTTRRVCIDSGCSLSRKGFGWMTALELDSGVGTYIPRVG